MEYTEVTDEIEINKLKCIIIINLNFIVKWNNKIEKKYINIHKVMTYKIN